MPKLSREIINARLLVLSHAAAWMRDQVTGEASSDILLDKNQEMSPVVAREAHKFCRETERKIKKLKSLLKELP